MRVRLIGRLNRPAVAVVGSWDPLLPAHLSLFRRLERYATRRSRSSLVIHLEPSPARHLNGALQWPTYDDIWTRVAIVAKCGVSASLVVRFRKRDLTAGAAEFMECVTEHATIRELWLGAYQTLGSCKAGSDAMIRKVARTRQIRITRLPHSPPDRKARLVRHCLEHGELEQATRIVGRSPVWSQPRSGSLQLPWRQGSYVAAALSAPDGARGKSLRLRLTGSRGTVPRCTWPHPAVKWLTLLRRESRR